MVSSSAPVTIGIFDSGVGGLSVLKAVRAELSCHPVIYLADQAHVPYGERTKSEVRAFAIGITQFLLNQGAQLIVVACNAASAAALYDLRATYPNVPFVGMEPAVKPAASSTHSGVIGILATPVTFQGELYASVVERFAKGVTILQDTCPGLVKQIETGALDSPQTRAILLNALQPMIAKGVDTVVMGCTHYPFIIPLVQQIVGPHVQVIDPAPAVARQAGRLLESRGLRAVSAHTTCAQATPVRFFTTGNPYHLREMLPMLLGETHDVQYVQWESGKLQ
jgi:glutamate racemase